MKFIIVYIALILAVRSTFADGLNGLCQQDIEGSYIGTIGQLKARINLFCVDSERLMATVCVQVNPGKFSGDAISNLSLANIDNDQLVLSNFELANDDRRSGSSKSMMTYFRVDIAKLQAGELSGNFMNSSLTDFQPLEATRAQKLPKIAAASMKPLLKLDVVGAYKTDMPSYDPGSGTNLIFDILLGTPVAYLVDVKAHTALHFADGPLWDNSGAFSLATAEGNGGEPDDKSLFYLRGAFSDSSSVSFYRLNPANGVEGPFHGQRLHPGP